MCLLIKEHNTACSLAKGIKPKSDPVSGSTCQFARKAETEEHAELHQYAINKIYIMESSYRSKGLDSSIHNCKQKIASFFKWVI